MKEVFAVLGKLPQRGFSKTRLAKDLGDDAAILLYHSFIDDFFKNFKKNIKLPFYFFGTPAVHETYKLFNKKAYTNELDFDYYEQPEKPFFERLKAIFEVIEEKEGECFIHLTGTDIPDFPFNKIKLGRCEKNLLSIGPDSDGGYYYLGTHSKNLEIFSIEKYLKSGLGVFNSTIKVANVLNLKIETLEEWSGIDDLSDLKNTLARSDESVICHTRDVCKILKIN